MLYPFWFKLLIYFLSQSICKDFNWRKIYKITITNGSANAKVLVRGTLNLASGATNMYWKLLTDATTTTEAGYTTNVQQGTAGYLTVGGNTGGSGAAAATLELAGSAHQDIYVMVWLEETGSPQETTAVHDAGKSYTGTVTFNAVDASGNTGTGVTATFTAG